MTTTQTPAPAQRVIASPWRVLREYHAAEMARYHRICEGFSVEQVVAPAIAISIWQAHKTALAKMDEMEAARPAGAGMRELRGRYPAGRSRPHLLGMRGKLPAARVPRGREDQLAVR